LCANYLSDSSNEGCFYLEEDEINCVYDRENEQERRCSYFEQAVLPADPFLEVEYWGSLGKTSSNVGTCENCGEQIVKTSASKKYCDYCSDKRKKQSTRDSVQKSRKKG